MAEEKKVLSQKEYLKKYLSSGDGEERKKKKKKKLNVGSKTVKIIDDDIDLTNMRPIQENEFDILIDTEDAPQIVGVVDERGPVDFSDKRRWKIITENEVGELTITTQDREINSRNNSYRKEKHKKTEISKRSDMNNDSDDYSSPMGRQTKYFNNDQDSTASKLTKDNENNKKKSRSMVDENSDLSPPRKQSHKKHKDIRRNKKSQTSSDADSDCVSDRPSKSKIYKMKSNKDAHGLNLNSSRNPKLYKWKDNCPRKKKTNYTTDSDSDLSPPRNKRDRQNNSDSDLSPPRNKKDRQNNSDSDLSPPRKKRDRQNNSDSDLSPPRRGRRSKSESESRKAFGKKYKDSDSDFSPPRKNKNYRGNNDSDNSPPRSSKSVKQKNRHSHINSSRMHWKDSDSDLNPSQKNRKYEDRNKNGSVIDIHKHKDIGDSDLSPQRRSRKDKHSLPRSSENYKRSHKKVQEEGEPSSQAGKSYYDSDLSPLRKRNKDSSRYSSPASKFGAHDKNSYRSKPAKLRDRYEEDRRHHSNRDSRKQKSRWHDDKRSEQSSSPEHRDKRMKKTLDGKTAGLQDAKALRDETEAHKKREAEQFKKLSKEISGVGKAAIVRDSKTGRKRDLEAEAAEEREKQKRQEELDEKYAKWGKGLKQVEDREEKLKNDLYEMSKPLARYADDADLDKELREQEREGDPMLQYIRQKQIKEGKRKPDRPKYEGSFMPNRFGIKPGHRWDGVDRSNGYEKKWFEAQNAKIARQEEAYKWSTSDM